jgi:two-component system, NtrC family, response regulator AtoC
MPDKMILYGEVVAGDQRRTIEDAFGNLAAKVTWLMDRSPLPSGNGPRTVIVDLDNPSFAEPEFLVAVAQSPGPVKLIGKSARPSLEAALETARYGVAEILTAEQCLKRLEAFLVSLEAKPVPEPTPSRASTHNASAIVGKSESMRDIRRTVDYLGEVDFPSALILGETGTGKSLVSKVLHTTGLRANFNLVEVNCSAIPDELFESELFGHAKGAFTDAKVEKIGLFEYAQNGTLFLDEVGNLSLSAQAKLLKVLEDKKLRKVGDIRERDINVRVVAATNCDLQKAILAGRFREDLYFRLNLLTIDLPPLRERLDDLPEMVGHFLKLYATIYAKPDIELDPEAFEGMKQYHWPGNVRELSNVIERAVLLTKGKLIHARDINVVLKSGRVTARDRQRITIDLPDQGISLEDIEARVALQVLNMCNWNKSEAAAYLKTSRPRLRRIIERAGLEQNRRSH